MIGKPKTQVPPVVRLEPPRSHRDPMKHGLRNQTVRVGTDAKLPRSVKVRRSLPIRAYIGPNGHGKSLAAVLDLMPSLDRGRPVLSTVPLYDWRAVPDPDLYELDPELGLWVSKSSGTRWVRPLHPAYIRLHQWRQLMDFDFGDVFLDEVAGVASSRQSSGMPAAIEKLLQKLRKSDITLSWTAPSWARADIIIRETTQAVTMAEGSRPERQEYEGRLWRRNRFFQWTTFDAAAYTDWTEGKIDRAKRLCFQRYWLPGKPVGHAYDSLGAVDTIVSVTDAGRCVDCGGTRRAPACSCPEYVARMAEVEDDRRAARKRSEHGPEVDRPSPADGHTLQLTAATR